MPFSKDESLNPSSPAGQVRSVGEFATGLTRLSGWRRELARWLVLLVVATPLVVFMVTAILR